MRISDGPFENQQLLQWAGEVAQEYPNYRETKGAPFMIYNALTRMTSPDGTLVTHIAHDGPILYGIITYFYSKQYNYFKLLEYAVLPQHRNKGVGTALLEHVKAKASRLGMVLFAGGMLDPAFPRLKKAGFWKAKERHGDPLYKWSDLPEQQNNYVPDCDGD